MTLATPFDSYTVVYYAHPTEASREGYELSVSGARPRWRRIEPIADVRITCLRDGETVGAIQFYETQLRLPAAMIDGSGNPILWYHLGRLDHILTILRERPLYLLVQLDAEGRPSGKGAVATTDEVDWRR